MAERRRIIPASVGPDFNGSHDQPEKPTRRFTVTLPESNDKTSPEFSYTDLVKEAGGVVEEEKAFNDLEEDDLTGLAALARKFEEKYGVVKGRKKRKRLEDVVDVGLGYDEDDPFVDNSECYDELVPSVLTTKFGGFYINSGDLQFKELSGQSDDSDFEVIKKRKKYQKRKKRKPLDSDDEKPTKPKKRQLSGSSDASSTKKKLKKKLQRQLSSGKEEKKKKKKKLNIPKAPTIAELLKSKKDTPEDPAQVKKETNGLGIQNGPDSLGGPAMDGLDRIDPSMDIGVPNLPMDSEMAALLSDTLADMGEGDDLPDMDMSSLQQPNGEGGEELVQLPDGVSGQLEREILRIREAARKSAEGKCKFFTPAVNSLLLEIENQTRVLTCGKRSSVYSHLAYHLPCTKDTLLKRAKKLRLGAHDSQLKEPIMKLKEAISEVMPGLIERYQDECTAAERARQERIEDEGKSERNASQDEDEEKSRRFCNPRRKFIWTDHLRNLLCHVVSIKLKTYEMSKTRSQSAEDYLKAFLEQDIKQLWPAGWMQTRMLFKESRSVHSAITSMPPKTKKPKLASKRPSGDDPSPGPSAPASSETTPENLRENSPNISPHSENSLSPAAILVQGAKEFPTLLDYAESPSKSPQPAGQEGDWERTSEPPPPPEDRIDGGGGSKERDKPSGMLSLLRSAMSEVVKKLEEEKSSGDESGGVNVVKTQQSAAALPKERMGGCQVYKGSEMGVTGVYRGQEETVPLAAYRQMPQESSGPKTAPSIRSPQSIATSPSPVSPVGQPSQQLLISPQRGVQAMHSSTKSPHSGVKVTQRPLTSPRGGGHVTKLPRKSPQSSGHATQQPLRRPAFGGASSVRAISLHKGPTRATLPPKHSSLTKNTHVRVGPNSNNRGHQQSSVRTVSASPSVNPLSKDTHSQPVVRLTRHPGLDQMSSSMHSHMRVTVKPVGSSKVTVKHLGLSSKGSSTASGSAAARQTSALTIGHKTKVPSHSPMKAPSPSVSPNSQAVYAKQRHSPVDRQQMRTTPHSPKVPTPAASPTQYPVATSGVHRVSPSRVSPTVSPYPPPQTSALYRAMHQQIVRPMAAGIQRRGSLPNMVANQRVTSPMSSPTFTGATEGMHPQMGPRGYQQLASSDPPRKAISAAGIVNLGQRKAHSNAGSPTFPGISVPGMVGRSASVDQASTPPVSGAPPGVVPGMGFMPGQARVPGMAGRSALHLNQAQPLPVSEALPGIVPGMGFMPGQVRDPNYDNSSQGQSRLL